MFTIFPVLFAAVFIAIIGLIIAAAVKGAKQYRRNNESPVLTVECRVAAKRETMRRHNQMTGNDGQQTSYATTDYFITFEVESGDRIELEVNPQEYGMIAERDSGKLTFQGTRYKSFVRYR